MRCHSVTFLKLPEKIALILIPDNPGLFLQSKALYRTTEEPSSEIFFFSDASSRRDGVCFSSRINRLVQSALFCVFQARATFRPPSKTVWYDSKRIQAQAVINRPAPDDITMIGFDDLPIADSLYITFLILLLSAA